MVDDSIITKIQALLRMAEHPNSNQNEAAIALERAQELLFKHNLTRADISTNGNQTAIPAGIGKIEGTELDGYNWKSHLLGSIARNTLCNAVRSPSNNKWTLFGTYSNVQSTLTMYNWIVPQLIRMNSEAWQLYDGTESRRTFNNGFYLGACRTIGERLQKPMTEFAYGSGHDIVIFNQNALSTAVKKIFPHVVKSHTSTRSYDGLAYGKRAGERVSFKDNPRLSGTLRLAGAH